MEVLVTITMIKKWDDWLFMHPRVAGLLLYGCLFVGIIAVGHITFAKFNFLFQAQSISSARGLISTLVQCEAAIVAIVISLTLVAIELTASTYSPRVITAFRNNLDMRIVLGSYIISIIYGLILLILLEEEGVELLRQMVLPFDYFVSFALWLGIFSIVTLVPYMFSIIDLLMPVTIISRLSNEVTNDDILIYIETQPKEVGQIIEDPLLPILDIVLGALGKEDLGTTKKGLYEILTLLIKLFDSEKGTKENVSRISGYISYHLQNVGILAAKIKDEELIKIVIENLSNIGKYMSQNGLGDATNEIISALKALGENTMEKGLKKATVEAIHSLGVVGKYSAEKGLKKATVEAVYSLSVIGEAATKRGKELEEEAMQTVNHLAIVGDAATKGGIELEEAVWQTAHSLRNIGKIAAEKELESVTWDVISSLKSIGEHALKEELEAAAVKVVLSIENVGVASVALGKDLERTTKMAVLSLETLGKYSAEKGLKNATREAASSIGVIAEVALGKGLADVAQEAKRAVDSLGPAAKLNP